MKNYFHVITASLQFLLCLQKKFFLVPLFSQKVVLENVFQLTLCHS